MGRTKRAPKLWYVIAVEPGQEKKIRRKIVTLVKLRELTKEFGRIFIPHHLEDRLRNGKWTPCRTKSFPGYMLIHLRYTNETFHVIESMKRHGVFGFLNLKPQLGGVRYPRKEKPQRTPPKPWELEKHEEWKPTAVHDLEAAVLLLREQDITKQKKEAKKKGQKVVIPEQPKHKVGDEVTIRTGTFADYTGKVIRALDSQDGQTLTVEVQILGRPARIGIGGNDVERKVV